MSAPVDDRRFTLGLVFAVAAVLAEAGYPPITSGGDLVSLQQRLYGFLYLPKPARGAEESRGDLAEHALSTLVTIGMLDSEAADALISLWERRDRLTAIELDAIRAAVAEPVSETDDGPSCDHPACQPGGSLYGIVHAHALPEGDRRAER